MSFERGPSCPPVVEVERHAAGEAVESKWQEHIVGCDNCAAHTRELQQGADAFIKSRPSEMFLRQVERRAEAAPKRRPMLMWLTAGLGTLAVASLAVVLAPRLMAQDEVRFKGGGVEIYYKREGMTEAARVLEGVKLKPNDTLRFRHRGEADAHVAVLERDSAGVVTAFVPFNGSNSVRLKVGEFAADAVTLDATVGKGTLFVISAEEPFQLWPLIQSAKSGAVPSCTGCAVDRVDYEKTQ